MPEKKSRYTEAQAKAAKKYLKESVEDIRIRVPKGQKAVIKDHAEAQGESMNGFVVRAITEAMERDNREGKEGQAMSEQQDFSGKFFEWACRRSPAEGKMSRVIGKLESLYFEDMTFQKGSICYSVAEPLLGDDGRYLDISSNCYRFYISDKLPEGSLGVTDYANRTITILRKSKNKKAIVLHEMIHAYEHIMYDYHPTLNEALLFALYNKLKKDIPNLDILIGDHINMDNQYSLACRGGRHGLLFYLKSLDLDLRCGFRLGTVFGYGYDGK